MIEKWTWKGKHKALLLRVVVLLLLQFFLSKKTLLLVGLRDSAGQERESINGQASQSMTRPKPRPGVGNLIGDPSGFCPDQVPQSISPIPSSTSDLPTFRFLELPGAVRNIFCRKGFSNAGKLKDSLALNHTCLQIHLETLVYDCVSCVKLPTRSFLIEPQTESHLKDNTTEVMPLDKSLVCDPDASMKAALWPMGQRSHPWQVPPTPGSWVSKAVLKLLRLSLISS